MSPFNSWLGKSGSLNEAPAAVLSWCPVWGQWRSWVKSGLSLLLRYLQETHGFAHVVAIWTAQCVTKHFQGILPISTMEPLDAPALSLCFL